MLPFGTTREVEQAERVKKVQLVKAEQDAIGVTTAAQAEEQAAQDKATAITTLAEAEAERVRIASRAEADAELMKADAQQRLYEVEAVGKQRLNEAANLLSNEQIAMQVRMALIEQLPTIIAESVKPMQKIDSIRIVQAEGLTGGAGGGEATAPGNLAEQVVNSAMRYRAQAPLLDALMKELGMQGGDLNGLTSGAWHRDTPNGSETSDAGVDVKT